MAAYGAPTWFGLGDRDLATHLVRTRALRAGQSLSAITAELARALGVAPRLLADERRGRAHDDPHAGRAARLPEYFVRDKCQVSPRRRLRRRRGRAAGTRRARGDPRRRPRRRLSLEPGDLRGPILAVPGVADALTATRATWPASVRSWAAPR